MLAYWVCSYKIPNTVVRELERLFTNFLWNKMHAWGWSDICKTKALGGLGIRKLKGIRLVWRLCTTSSIWAQWMQAHYGGVHLLLENARILDSGTWKWIHSSKSQALMHMTKKIGNDRYLFFNNWLPEGRISDLLSPNQIPHALHSWKVSSISNQNNWCMRDDILQPV